VAKEFDILSGARPHNIAVAEHDAHGTNKPHILIFIAAYWIATMVDKPKAGAAAV
jgi:hypothetical protein